MYRGIVDSHQHVWKVGLFDYPWMSPDLGVLYRDYAPQDLEAVLSGSGVGRSILVQASNSMEETRWMLSLADAHPFVAGVVGWVDLASGEAGRQLDELRAHPRFSGVRHLVESEADTDWLVRPAVLEGLGELAARGLPFDLLVHTKHLKHVPTIVEACPDLRMVVDHLAKPAIASREFDEWATAIERVAAIESLHCKLSGLVTEADHRHWRVDDLRPYVEHALACFGPSRLMYGSDYPVCLLAASYDRVLDACRALLDGLDEVGRSAIFGENAARFYSLNP
jgi:L-fuconolactonase